MGRQHPRGAVGIVRDLLDNLKDIVFGILRFDWCRIAAGFTGLGLDVFQAVFLVPRILGGIVGGVRNAFNEDQVEEIVDEALRQTFARDPPPLPPPARSCGPPTAPSGPDPRRGSHFFISSRGTGVDLRDLNRRRVIDLSSAVGLWSRCAGSGSDELAALGSRCAGTGAKVSSADVKAFLDGGPERHRSSASTRPPRNPPPRPPAGPAQGAQISVRLTLTIADYEVKKPDKVPVAATLTALTSSWNGWGASAPATTCVSRRRSRSSTTTNRSSTA